MVDFKTVQAFDFQGKTVVLRADLNVPMKDGVITDNERILASLDTIKYLLGHNCKIVLLSHLSRVKSLDDKKGKKSLQPVASALQNLLKNTKVHFCPENTGDKVKVAV
ncbi:phosphoglycerate kinase, partial [Mycoplasmoides pneumoniae]